MIHLKIRFLTYLVPFLILLSCSNWNKDESIFQPDLENPARPDSYYQNLRRYKATEHPLSFGILGEWYPDRPSLKNALTGAPDSMDMVAIRQGWQSMSAAKIKDLRSVQIQKGTKVFIRADLNQLSLGLCDTVTKYNFDGLLIFMDYDSDKSTRIDMILESLAQSLTNNHKLLLLECKYLENIPPGSVTLADYLIIRAFSCFKEDNFNYILKKCLQNLPPEEPIAPIIRKTIFIENFQKSGSTGGTKYSDKNGVPMPSFEGMARWIPEINNVTYQKAGVGTYFMETEYSLPGQKQNYPAMRKAIRIMNNASI